MSQVVVRERRPEDIPRLAEILAERRGWTPVGEARPPWPLDDEPPVIAMILPPAPLA